MTKRNITALGINNSLGKLMSYLSSRSYAAPSWSPQGKVEYIDDEGFVTGWVADSSNPSATVTVRIYIDWPGRANFFEQVGPIWIGRLAVGYGWSRDFDFKCLRRWKMHAAHLCLGLETGTGIQLAQPVRRSLLRPGHQCRCAQYSRDGLDESATHPVTKPSSSMYSLFPVATS